MAFLASAADPTSHVTDVILWAPNGLPPITMHTLTLLVVGAIFLFVMLRAAKAIATGPESMGNARYVTKGRLSQVIEVMVLYLRDEMLTPVLGAKETRRFLPFLMTLFFFILFVNLFGLVPVVDAFHLLGVHTPPFGGTATASITVTGALAIVAAVVIQIHGFRQLGLKGWLEHCFGGLVPGPVYLLPVALVVFVVELAGHFIKPAALAIRLFANMVAGHTLMAVLLGFGAMAVKGGMGGLGVGGITLVTGVAAVLITFLELFVAFLQAFIFMFLTTVFLSLMSHHDDHEHEHEEEHHGEAAVAH